MFSDDKPTRSHRKSATDSRGQSDPVDRFPLTIEDLVFVGFNSQIVALDRATGELIWHWTSPKGGGFVALLLDGDQLIVSVSGYTYCIDPASGETLWTNLLKGFGFGVPCLVSTRGTTLGYSAAAAEAEAQKARQSTGDS